MNSRYRRTTVVAALMASGGFLLATGGGCLNFGGEQLLLSTNLCFVFDCDNGILGGTIDPCSTYLDAEGNEVRPLLIDCPQNDAP